MYIQSFSHHDTIPNMLINTTKMDMFELLQLKKFVFTDYYL